MLIKIGDAFVDPHEIVGIMPGSEPPYAVRNPLIWIRLRGNSSSIQVHTTMDEAEAALIDAGVIEELTCDELPELSEEELQTLSGLRARGYEYLARDEDGRLYAYKFPPAEDQGFFMPGSPAENAERIDRSFDFIAPGEFFAIGELLPG